MKLYTWHPYRQKCRYCSWTLTNLSRRRETKSICLEVCDDDDDDDATPRDVFAVQANYVVDLKSFSFILQVVVMCRSCEVGSIELFDPGKKTSCTNFCSFGAILAIIQDPSVVLVVRLVSHCFSSAISIDSS